MKKLISFVISICVIMMSIACISTVSVSAAIEMTDEAIAAKNYPLPQGYKVKTVQFNYDEKDQRGTTQNGMYSVEWSDEEGTYYDTASMKITTKNAYREIGAFGENRTLDGTGFMFWYKGDCGVNFRLRSPTNNSIVNYGYLDACPEGRWVTYYYYGASVNMNFNNSSARKDIRQYIANDYLFDLKFYFGDANERSVYIDEFITIEPIKTAADTYSNDEEFLKFSLNHFANKTTTLEEYSDDGSVTLSSTYGETGSRSPVNITYNLDLERVKKAIEIAKKGSGYLQVKCDNISCKASDDTDAYARIQITLNGIDKTLQEYNIGSGSSDTYLIRVDDIENPDDITNLTIKITEDSSIKDVKFKFSPITVYNFGEDEIILQAEDLNPKHKDEKNVITDVPTTVSMGNNREYVHLTSSANGRYLSFDLPEMEVGEYDVYASCLTNGWYNTKCNVSVNNLKQVDDVVFREAAYSNRYKGHNTNIEIGKLTLTKNYSDGKSVLKLTSVPKYDQFIYIDYFSFTKTDTEVTAEPSENFVIKEYPEIDRYEVKTVFNTFDEYICSGDSRYYKENQLAGYVGDGNAFNLNSRGTLKKAYFDNNNIWNGSSGLDGDGIRFWYKFNDKADMQLKNSSGQTVKTLKIPKNTEGGWYTVYYTDVVENGDLSNIVTVALKTSNGGYFYIDEFHSIQQKSGEVIYELNGDGTASVVGYDLRIDNIEIADTYKDCPVTTIKEGALSNSKTLSSVVLPDSITTIEKNAFANDLNLKKITFGSSIKTIGAKAFSNCPKLAENDFPASLKNVDATAFEGCESLIMQVANRSYIKIYATKYNIDYRCTVDNFTYLYKDEIMKIESYNGEKETVTVPEKEDDHDVTIIGSGAFADNKTLKSVTIPNTVTLIESEVFSGCSALIDVVMSTNIDTIEENVFNGCSLLKSFDLGDKITTIGDTAFKNCAVLGEFTLPESLTSIGTNAFSGCSNLVADVVRDSYAYIYVNQNSILQIPQTSSEFKYSIVNYEATVINYVGSTPRVDIPDTIDGYTVIAIGKEAFSYNTTITFVSFSDNCKTIYENAFLKCTSLTGFNINDVRSIKAYAFGYCTELGDVIITNVVTYSEYAFYGCTKLNLSVIETQFARTAMELCNSWHVGINLGNTFDAMNSNYKYGDLTPEQGETLWGAPVTTKPMIDFLADGGFDVLRFPVSWSSFINDEDDYKVDEAYMARVQEIVDWAIAKDMYVVLNVHHDTTGWLDLKNYSDDVCRKFERLWEQIADHFKDYDEHLVFESLNEARTGNDWDANSDGTLMSKFNSLQKLFYNTVRATGGYNDVRYLMLETYGAQAKERHCASVWYPSLEEDDHIMMSTHFYTNNIGEGYFGYNLGICKTYFTDKGIPCVLGETGMQNFAPSFDEEHARWTDAVMNVAERCGMKILFWDDHGGFQMFNRYSLTWQWPSQIETIMEHAYAKEVVEDPIPIIKGDVNDDGVVDMKDSLWLVKYLAGIQDIAVVKNNTDMDDDGGITAVDLLMLRKALAKVPSE